MRTTKQKKSAQLGAVSYAKKESAIPDTFNFLYLRNI